MNQVLHILGLSAPTFPIGPTYERIEWLRVTLNKFINTLGYRPNLVVLPELFTIGYPPGDLLYSPSIYNRQKELITEINNISKILNVSILFGGYRISRKGKLYNCAYLSLPNKKVIDIHDKIDLPNYNIFAEKRYFVSGDSLTILKYGPFKLGILICEEFWIPSNDQTLVAYGVDALIVMNASPYVIGKPDYMQEKIKYKYELYQTPIMYVNWYGGQDEVIYMIPSMVVSKDGLESSYKYVSLSLSKEETLNYAFKKIQEKRIQEMEPSANKPVKTTTVGDVPLSETKHTIPKEPCPKYGSKYQQLKDALILGIESYFKHANLDTAIIGVSGGIDSAVVLALLLKCSNIKEIKAYFLPSEYTSKESYEAITLLQNYANKYRPGFYIETVHIESIVNSSSISAMFKTVFGEDKIGIAKQNLQARLRGLYLSTISNMIPNSIVVSCGNKSEYALGYATLYGDMVGGIAPLKDIYKSDVFELAKELDIPEFIINRKPSAELDENQYDEDDLGNTYQVLDKVLRNIIEELDFSDEYLTMKVLKQEFKRRQGPIGFKVSKFAFENDRLFPINVSF